MQLTFSTSVFKGQLTDCDVYHTRMLGANNTRHAPTVTSSGTPITDTSLKFIYNEDHGETELQGMLPQNPG